MDVGVTPANQHKILEEGRRLHRDPYIRSESPLVRRKKILYIRALH
jgi:hypothetical protein